MKKQLFKILMLFIFISCTTTGKSEYIGKTVKSIDYHKNTSPYMMVIKFTDGSILYVCANKYCLDVMKK